MLAPQLRSRADVCRCLLYGTSYACGWRYSVSGGHCRRRRGAVWRVRPGAQGQLHRSREPCMAAGSPLPFHTEQSGRFILGLLGTASACCSHRTSPALPNQPISGLISSGQGNTSASTCANPCQMPAHGQPPQKVVPWGEEVEGREWKPFPESREGGVIWLGPLARWGPAAGTEAAC